MAGLTRRRRAMAVVDFDSRSVRVVRVIPARNGPRFKAPRSFALGDDVDVRSAESLGAFLGSVLAEMHLSACPLVMTVPRGRAVLKGLTLPAGTPEDEWAGMVRYQIANHLPYASAEAVVDFCPARHVDPTAEGDQADGTCVLVAAVESAVVEFYRRLAAAAGARLARLGLRPAAGARCVVHCTKRAEDECVVLVDITADETEIDFVIGDSLIFSRAAHVGAPADAADVQRRQRVVKALVLEVVRSSQSVQAAGGGAALDAVLVAGETTLADEVATALAQRLRIPCEVFRPAEALGLGDEMDGGSFSALFGAGMNAGEAGGLDFLNPRQPVVKPNSARQKAAAIALVAILALFGGGVARHLALSGRRANSGALTARAAAAARTHADKIKPLIARASRIEAWRDGGTDWLAHWARLSALLPSATEVYCKGFRGAPNGTMSFTVKATNRDAIDRLQKTLEGLDGYTRVKVSRVAARSDDLHLGYDYESTIQVVVSPGATVDLTGVKASRPPDDDSAAQLARGVASKGGRQ